ncbi:MAG: tryptophan 2,3-dioxygenase [Streptosporangiaceae bacterium]
MTSPQRRGAAESRPDDGSRPVEHAQPAPEPDSAHSDPAHSDTARNGEPHSRSFGEEGGRLTYSSYLRLPELLDQQVPQAEPPAHDELLFITVHQVYELWFKQLLFEVESARDEMLGGRPRQARHLLRRVHAIERLLVAQVEILETMTPQDFLEFRSTLAPASGFQSAQFRELEFLSGAKDESFLSRFRALTDAERQRLNRRLAEPSLWDGFVALLSARGLATGDDKQVLASLVSVARRRDEHDDLWQLSDDLLTHDELAAQWRARHVAMVERQIGTKSGTGGSTGAPYLRRRLGLHYYPLLWELRDAL